MDVKAFGLGAMCGIAVSALVFLVVSANRDEPTAAPSSRETAAEAAPARALQHAPTLARPPSEVTPGSSGDVPAASEPKVSEAQNELSPWPPSRAARAQEPKDVGWSYNMEQTLSGYLATHPKAAQFDFRSVDCRTTFCEIQAIGVDESTSPVWSQVTYDVQQQPWSEFDMMGSDQIRSQDGGPLYRATFHRKQR